MKSKYGFCPGIKRWVPRDTMLGINVRVFDEDNEQSIIRIRLSPKAWKEFVDVCKKYEWSNDLRTEEELRADGIAVGE